MDEVNFRSLNEPGTGSNPYPDASEFTYPNPAPAYNIFVNHQDDIPLRSAQEGYLFKLDTSRMRWLVWNTINVANDALAGRVTAKIIRLTVFMSLGIQPINR